MKNKSVWFYGLLLDIVVIAFGVISPWWCSGHHTFTCTNSFGISWYTMANLKNFEIVSFTPSFGFIIAFLIVCLLWVEFERGAEANKIRKILSTLIFMICVIAVINTLLLVREANCYELFTAWTTKLIEVVFPTNISCTSQITWITDVYQGVWIAISGVLILLLMSFVKPLLRSPETQVLNGHCE
ncbi:MAG: hypothetical protein GY943_08615 [Chloroflexi bacterium]|nr:hypothetical protein [Chloroflexota bacterium]